MSNFSVYFLLGLEHILNWAALDHLLFILSLACIYVYSDYKKVLWLITAFTIGHSITLALATLHIIEVNNTWVEFLIPCTILLSAIYNLTKTKKRYKYGVVAFFGLIHGLGFSNYLQSLLGAESSLFTPLLGFNLGLELGQICVVAIVLLASFISFYVFHWKQKSYIKVLSGITIGLVLPMILERWP
ncbi:MAG: HupE/UreJ family protein [Cytophagales bacterium]|nr:HupE/UreJ family protein [Cytophagales bacterium]